MAIDNERVENFARRNFHGWVFCEGPSMTMCFELQSCSIVRFGNCSTCWKYFNEYHLLSLIVVDVDECADSSHQCGPAGMCMNVDDGTYTCTCGAGYEKVPAGAGADTGCTGKFR